MACKLYILSNVNVKIFCSSLLNKINITNVPRKNFNTKSVLLCMKI